MSLDSYVLSDLTAGRRMNSRSQKSDMVATGAGRPFTLATKIGATAGIFLAMLTVLLPGYFAFVGQFYLLPCEQHVVMENFCQKLSFTAKYWVLPLSWLVINCHLVAMSRIMTLAINPLSDNEHVIEAIKNVFTNSIEQFLLSAFSQIILIVYLNEKQVSALIPLINLLHLVGRIFFWLFYPRFRSYGFILTFLPTNIALGYGLYKLFATHVYALATSVLP